MTKTTFNVGDLVRVKQYGGRVGETIYEIASLGTGHPAYGCLIREWGPRPGNYRTERFDTSLLVRAGVKRDGYVYTAGQDHRGLWQVVETRDSGNRPYSILKGHLRTEAAAGKIIARIAAGEDFGTILAARKPRTFTHTYGAK